MVDESTYSALTFQTLLRHYAKQTLNWDATAKFIRDGRVG